MLLLQLLLVFLNRVCHYADVWLLPDSFLFLNTPVCINGYGYIIPNEMVAPAPVSFANRKVEGSLGDPFEGELMIFFLELMGENSTGFIQSAKLWQPVHRSVGQWKTYNAADYVGGSSGSAGLPYGAITVQKGWYFSTHELWKYLVR